MASIFGEETSTTLPTLVFLGLIIQVGLIWWAHRRAAKRSNEAQRQARKHQAELIEKEFKQMRGDK
jgi:hypothetical protein